MNIKLKVLSPLHIGCGEKYSTLDFFIDNRKMYCIEPDVFISHIGPEKTKRFVEWIEKCTQSFDCLENDIFQLKRFKDSISTEKTRALKRDLSKLKQKFTLSEFIATNNIGINIIINKSKYFVSVKKGIYNDSEINPFIKQMHRPYVPGTEIKGAVRTAILYGALMNNRSLIDDLKKRLEIFGKEHSSDIEKVRNNKRPDLKTKNRLVKAMEKTESALQENVFYYRPQNSRKSDPKFDVMKFLQISDSNTLDPDKVLAVSYVEPFNITNKFKPVYEFIDPDQTPEITISTFALEPETSLLKKLEKMHFSEDQKRIVSGLDSIFKACHLFSNDLLEEEIAFFQNHGKPLIAEKLKQIKTLNTEDAPVLRIGKDEGYNSLTVGLAVKKLAPELYENVLIHATKNKSYDSEHGGPLPKSRKIVHWNDEETTAGWVQLIKATEWRPDSTHVPPNQKTDDHQSPKTPVDFSQLQDRFKPARKNK